jgi:hypothetical protein
MGQKTIRRDWLKKQMAAGNIEIKCNMILTDDYAFDAAYNFQKSDWSKANIKDFDDMDFKYKSGYAYMDDNGLIHWTMLANHYYTCRLIKTENKNTPIKIEGVQIVDYSDKAIAVIGNTKPIKDILKSAGGRFNFRLNCGAGWIFPKSKKEELLQLI